MKIAILYPDDFSIWQFRKGMIEALISNGHDVYLLCPSGKYISRLEAIGTTHIAVNFNRFINPYGDLLFIIELYKIFKNNKFEIVHNLTIKPNIYGSIAAKLAKVKLILGTVEGMGSIYSRSSGLKIKLLKPIINKLYKIGLNYCHRVWFLNQDDISYFLGNKMIVKNKAILIRSTGVNSAEYSENNINPAQVNELKKELKIQNNSKIVLMVVGRFIWSKGIKEFIESYGMLKNKITNIRFLLVGVFENESPDSIPSNYLLEKESDSFSILNFRDDIKELIYLSDVTVLPSYYREGVPRILLESMSLSRPIITTNNVGCKETVDNGKNGYLIPIKDSKSLANSIEQLLIDPVRAKKFGKNGRMKVLNEFDEKLIVDQLLKKLYQI
jgi:N,N'-diacetylbacillosaminyl-diphospho-undecaprenol alpha-1,3-N-acetylgalactosaminyltransferase